MSRFFWRLVQGGWARNLVNNIATPGDRALQNRLDYERLYVLSRLHQELAAARRRQSAEGQNPGAPPPPAVNTQRLVLEAKSVPFPQQRDFVERHVGQQLRLVARATHEALLQAGDPAPAATRLAAAAGRQQGSSGRGEPPSSLPSDPSGAVPSSSSSFSTSPAPPPPSPSPASSSFIGRAELASLVRPSLGFALRVARSGIQHPDADLGVFVEGDVPPGTVVAVLPGLLYSRTQYSRMPNYPRIDTDNPYLSRRHDMDIVDSKPWGLGQTGPGAWVTPTCPEAEALSALEGRHPLALGHLVNHPAPGMQPNVLEVGFNWDPALEDEAWLRAYVPNCPLLDPPDEEEEEEQEAGSRSADAPAVGLDQAAERRLMAWCCRVLAPRKGSDAGVRGLALVATRSIRDGEELLQNYRLNPRGPQPDWYHAVDPEADARRWAQLPLSNIMALRGR